MPTALGGHVFEDMATQSRGHGTRVAVSDLIDGCLKQLTETAE
ncbi:MAG: hypothetical protein WD648_03140 [Planctomycetaceae bacterium]